MTDDNLDDVQSNKTAVQRTNEMENKKIWNAYEIRTLRK